MLARCYLRRLAGGDNLWKEHRTQVSREQVRVYPQGDRRVRVPQLAGDLNVRGAVRDQQGRTGMPDLMGVRDSRPAAFSNFRLALALVLVKSAEKARNAASAASGLTLAYCWVVRRLR